MTKPIVKLVAREGYLHVKPPKDDVFGRDLAPLIYVYPAGDCDVAPWPLRTIKHVRLLAEALYDAVETGAIEHMHGEFTVIMPDGSQFGYLGILEMPWKPYRSEE